MILHQIIYGDLMRIALPISDERGLESNIYEHFGHAPYYLLIDIEDSEIKKTEIIQNFYKDMHGPGSIPSFLAKNGVNMLICEKVGTRAREFFNRYGVKVLTGFSGKAKDILYKYLKREI